MTARHPQWSPLSPSSSGILGSPIRSPSGIVLDSPATRLGPLGTIIANALDGGITTPTSVEVNPPEFTFAVIEWTRGRDHAVDDGIIYYRVQTNVIFSGGQSFSIDAQHRYSKLLRFKDDLKDSNIAIPKFPGKKLFEKNDASLWDSRVRQLSEWFKKAQSWDLCKFAFVRKFLKIPTDEELLDHVNNRGGFLGMNADGGSNDESSLATFPKTRSHQDIQHCVTNFHRAARRKQDTSADVNEDDRPNCETRLVHQLENLLRETHERMIDVTSSVPPPVTGLDGAPIPTKLSEEFDPRERHQKLWSYLSSISVPEGHILQEAAARLMS